MQNRPVLDSKWILDAFMELWVAADFTLLCPAPYAKVKWIHLPCGLWTGVRERCCVSGDSEGPFMQHMPRTFCHHICEGRGRRAARTKGRDGGNGRRGEVIKGGGIQRRQWERNSLGAGCEKALPVGFHPSEDRNLGLCPLNMPPPYLVHLSFCL